MNHAEKTESLIALLGQRIAATKRTPHVLRGRRLAVWHDEVGLPEDASDLIARWNDGPIMDFGEFKAAGTVQLAADRALAQLGLHYVHDESGDNDRDVQVAVFAVDGGSVWVVADLLVDPDTGEGADPATLAAACGMPADARREEVTERILGHG